MILCKFSLPHGSPTVNFQSERYKVREERFSRMSILVFPILRSSFQREASTTLVLSTTGYHGRDPSSFSENAKPATKRAARVYARSSKIAAPGTLPEQICFRGKFGRVNATSRGTLSFISLPLSPSPFCSLARSLAFSLSLSLAREPARSPQPPTYPTRCMIPIRI